jgi:hypothetical protein
MKLNNLFSKKAILVAMGTSLIATGAYAASYSVTSAAASRDEVTGPGRTSGTLTASGTFKITKVGSGTLKLSIMQALNRKPEGGAEPITQLGIQKSGSKFSFYIVQGNQACLSTPVIGLNQAVTISMSVAKGASPTYTIGGVKCSKANSAGDRAGKLVRDDGSIVNDAEYYAKYGAYATNSNATSAMVDWSGASF